MLGQGHKIILTMSRWPNCPNMCGATICGAMWCQDSPKIRGNRGEKVKVKVK